MHRSSESSSHQKASHKRMRLDEILVYQGLAESRSQAKVLILAGKVRSQDHILDKASQLLDPHTLITITQPPRYVSRGGNKLEAFLKEFSINAEGLYFLDVGASTGGFTDCLLQHGASQAVCIDVGRGQLHYKLRTDRRVTNFEKVNARNFDPTPLPYSEYPLIVIDLSFISLKKVLPHIWTLLQAGGLLIALVKPQFEAEKHEVDKVSGVIKDRFIQDRILENILAFSIQTLSQCEFLGHLESPILGTDGNREFLLGIKKIPL